jgi:hypothetical protein
MIRPSRCPQCGADIDTPPDAIHRLLFSPKRYVSLEDDLDVTCSSCGYKGPIVQRKFFGILGARGVRMLVCILLIAFLVVVGSSLGQLMRS